jgi:hypothetical protein
MALYRGANLLAEQDYDPSTVVLSFFHSGKLVKRVPLGELYSDIDVLPRTVSHYFWLKAADWDGGKWSIRTIGD